MTGVLVGRDRGRAAPSAWRLLAERGGTTSRRRRGSPARSTRWPSSSRAFRDAGLARVMCQHMLHTDLDMVALIGEDLAPRL